MRENIPMTPERIQACYDLGKQVHSGKNKDDAVGELVDKHGMNEDSAKMYIQAFRMITKGEKLARSVNQGYLRYYFKKALDDSWSKEEIKTALVGLEKHIQYYFEKPKESGGNVPGLRKLHNKYSKEVGMSLTYESAPPYTKIR